MATARTAEEQPPALPLKQHRGQCRRSSSVGSDCVALGQHQNNTHNDVFDDAADCHAAQCPIHQRYDLSQHQMRFFSDSIPPPVPKKRLARTLSMPATSAAPLSPLPPVSARSQNFDNPLYILVPPPDIGLHMETEEFEPVISSPSLSLSQLSFDTPDEQLPYIFSSFVDQRVVSQGIQQRQLLFLRSMAQSVEAGVLLHRDSWEENVGSHQPHDFLLSGGSVPKQIGDSVYRSLHSPKLPGRVLALRVHKQNPGEAPSGHTKNPQSHVNVRDVIARFPDVSECTAAKEPGGGSGEQAADLMEVKAPTVESLLLRGHCVSVERDLPRATLEDFVKESGVPQCSLYDRRVCVLLLQILTGSQHLYLINACAAELSPREVFLVWPNEEAEEEAAERANQQEVKRSFKTDRLKDEMRRGGRMQMLWVRQGCPRVVLTPLSSAASTPHTLAFIKSQIGMIIRYCLVPQEKSPSPASAPALPRSPYRRGLLHLSSLLKDGNGELQLADMAAMLQVLLWGPRLPHFNRWTPPATAAHHWLAIKRALLVMKLAERGLVQDQSVLDWEDCVCLQYLSFTDPESVVSASSRLSLGPNVDGF